ncbi:MULTISPECIES: DNA polymerase III subunit gamma/tau [unclassified Microbacterium]|uniref:DNA polymerase III subunit gamma/tau n=1 Tax=unclassified Microbacterium TaxID=2609290 RepID=UPI00214CE5BE|nr:MULTISPECIES: DNA polymerase III subunit gamma/tau [unclassified Microbacterium]MCR2784580.1 DNA polymerase III subunit gamma/tau [Microbacterium sp. zg.B96]WIM14611.1 DNA polymerase III subunit gamma/tau [Microbacterium sp. zg-B96]
MARPDDDALTWDGDDDPTLAGNTGPAAPLPAGYRAVGKGSERLDHPPHTDAAADRPATESETAADAPAPLGNAALVGIGVFAGVYLLFCLGWLLGARNLQLVAQLFLDPIAFQVTLWLAVAAPPLWFATVFLLTRSARVWVRLTLLAAGAVLLVPWPFVLSGASL